VAFSFVEHGTCIRLGNFHKTKETKLGARVCLCVYANMYICICLFKENKSLYITCKYLDKDIDR